MREENYLFIGDSLTAWFDTVHFLPDCNIKNVAAAGDTTSETLDRMDERWFNPLPDKVFICIGTNDLARRRDPDDIAEKIFEIVERVQEYSPESVIVITSLFPVRNHAGQMIEDIDLVNNLLKSSEAKYGYVYFDLFTEFADEEGMLRDEYSDDGLHLTNLAYQKWSEEFNKFIEDYSK